MPLETNINEDSLAADLNQNWPLGTDPKSEGDDHIRNVKQVLQNVERRSNLQGLGQGSVPVLFDDTLEDSGTFVIKGGVEVRAPINFRSAFIRNPLDSGLSPMLFTPLGGAQRPLHFKTDDLDEIVPQPLDGEIGPGTVAFTWDPVQSVLLTSFRIRGAGVQVDNVRVTVKAADSDGPIVARTALDGELRTGQGFTIAPTGDTTVVLPQIWESFQGDRLFIEFDRYDAQADAFVKDGIPVRGATILGEFVPYFARIGYQYLLKEVAELDDIPAVGNIIQEVGYEEDTGNTVILVGTPLLSTNANLIQGETYQWELNISTLHGGGNDSYAEAFLSIGGANQDLTSLGGLGDLYSRQSGRTISTQFTGRYTHAGVDGPVGFVVTATLGNNDVTKLRAELIITRRS